MCLALETTIAPWGLSNADARNCAGSEDPSSKSYNISASGNDKMSEVTSGPT